MAGGNHTAGQFCGHLTDSGCLLDLQDRSAGSTEVDLCPCSRGRQRRTIKNNISAVLAGSQADIAARSKQDSFAIGTDTAVLADTETGIKKECPRRYRAAENQVTVCINVDRCPALRGNSTTQGYVLRRSKGDRGSCGCISLQYSGVIEHK